MKTRSEGEGQIPSDFYWAELAPSYPVNWDRFFFITQSLFKPAKKYT